MSVSPAATTWVAGVPPGSRDGAPELEAEAGLEAGEREPIGDADGAGLLGSGALVLAREPGAVREGLFDAAPGGGVPRGAGAAAV